MPFRKINSLDIQVCKKGLQGSELCQDTPSQLDKSVKSYNFMLAVLEKHAVLLMKVRVIRLCVPWFNDSKEEGRTEMETY